MNDGRMTDSAHGGEQPLPQEPSGEYDPEKELNETRYASIMASSKVPVLGLFKAALEEDTSLLLPRVLYSMFGTMRRIPHSLFMKSGPEREDYIYQTFVHWAKRVCKTARIELVVKGAEKIAKDKTYLFVSNHKSPVDIPAIYAALPKNAAFVANGIFRRIPILSYWMKESGSVFIDQGDPKSELAAFKTMIRRLKKGRNLIIFPEGHIHQGRGVDDFSRGGIYSAVMAGVNIAPVCLFGTDHVMRAGSLHINPRKRVTVEFGDPIDTSALDRKGKKEIDLAVHDSVAGMRAVYEREYAARRRAASRNKPK